MTAYAETLSLSGITSLTNPNCVDEDKNLDQIEQMIMSATPTQSVNTNAILQKELDALSKEFGITIDSNEINIPQQPKSYDMNLITNDNELMHQIPLTEDDQKRQIIDKIMGTIPQSAADITLTSARATDDKIQKLEQIEQAIDALEASGVNCKNVPKVSLGSSDVELDAVLRWATLKHDSSRQADFIEEIAVSGAKLLGNVLDGTYNIPVLNVSPDYRDYHLSLKVKLNRMRNETASLVNTLTSSYNIRPATRVAAELITSFLLYPTQRASHARMFDLRESTYDYNKLDGY